MLIHTYSKYSAISNVYDSFAIGIVGDAGVRGTAQQPRLYVGMILILIFAEVLGKSRLDMKACHKDCADKPVLHRSLRADRRSSHELALKGLMLNNSHHCRQHGTSFIMEMEIRRQFPRQ